jgi:dihydroxyacetone kinase-like protein
MIDLNDFKRIISLIRATMSEKRDYLIELDSQFGDGDMGITMVKAFDAAEAFIHSVLPPADLGAAISKMGIQIAKSAPSTMGTLIATGFMRGGRALLGKTYFDFKDTAEFFDAFVNGIMERGKSKPGEKTIVDVLFPVAKALASTKPCKAEELFEMIYKVAENALEETKNMVAKHGRAAYFHDSTIGKHDPGATAALYIIQGFKDHFSRQ